jgi:RHS repeat-associated protein
VAFGAGEGAGVSIDPNGNTTQKVEGADTWTYEWNADNRLVKVLKNAAEVASYKYDPVGRRVEQLGQTPRLWAYDTRDVMRETRADIDTRYVHSRGVDEPLAFEEGGMTFHYQADALGSIVTTTLPNGGIASSHTYEAWGNTESGAGAPSERAAFTGREWDPGTDLFYYRARYYDSSVGRFISEDPIGFGSGPNAYAYVLNSPVDFRDPSGLDVRRCSRPLTGYPDDTVHFRHHWLCVKRATGEWDCGGQMPDRNQARKDTMSFVPVDGEDPGHVYMPVKCKEKVNPGPGADQSCFEECIRERVTSSERPPFAMGPFGTDCQEWADDATVSCILKCPITPPPQPAPPPTPTPPTPSR